MAHDKLSGNVLVHLVWSTCNRERVLMREDDPWLERSLSYECFQAGSQVFAVGIATDHVHLAIGLGAATAMSDLVWKLKGASIVLWNQFRSCGLSWEEGFWAESIHPAKLRFLCEYIKNQRQHHRACDVLERWMFRPCHCQDSALTKVFERGPECGRGAQAQSRIVTPCPQL